MNVDLIWDEEAQTWSGLFERGAFRQQVSLKRPAALGAVSPFAGTWSNGRGGMLTCVHIAQQQDGALAAWTDRLQVPGQIRYANNIQSPRQAFERYGELAKAKVDASGQITVELAAYSPMCCPYPFMVKLSADGQSLLGAWQQVPNHIAEPVVWKKMPGVSCVSNGGLR